MPVLAGSSLGVAVSYLVCPVSMVISPSPGPAPKAACGAVTERASATAAAFM